MGLLWLFSFNLLFNLLWIGRLAESQQLILSSDHGEVPRSSVDVVMTLQVGNSGVWSLGYGVCSGM